MMAVDRRMMAVLAAFTLAVAGACGSADDADSREQAASTGGTKLATMGEDVLKMMAEPKVPGRIIYDAPTDLSYASAQLRRPDLVRADTARRSGQAAPKDTTRGEEAAKPGTGGSRRDTTRQKP
ncbi:MAG: hypothetical protein ACR2G6_00485 [Gemmatimonadaceae bacterium]